MRYLAAVLSNTPLVLDALLLDELLGREDSLRELLRLEALLALLVGHHLQHSQGLHTEEDQGNQEQFL